MSIKWMIKKSDYNEIRKSVNKDADNKKLEALKKEVIAILEKKDSQELKKAIEYFEQDELRYSHLEKSLTGEWIEKAGYGVGTVRIWKGKKYKKVSSTPTRWVRVFDKNDRGASTSMGRYIAQVKKCESVEELYQFCMKQRSLFQDNNGVDLPIMDKLRSVIDSQSNKIENEKNNATKTNEYMKEDLANLKAGNYSFGSFEDFKAEINKQAGDKRGAKQPNYIGYLKISNDDYLKKVYDAMPKAEKYDDDKAFEEYKKLASKEDTTPEENSRIGELVKEHFKHSDKKWPGGAALRQESENKTYWIQDFKGNRITSDDAKNKIKENFNKIDALKESFKSKDKAGQIKAAADMTYLQDENQHLLDRLNADDCKEMESESEKHQNRSDAMKGNKNAYKGKAEEIANKKILSKEDMLKKPLSTIQKYGNADVYDIGKFNSIEDALNDSFETYKGSIDLGELTENELSERVGKEWAKKQNHDVAREIFKEYNDGKLVPNDKGILEPNKKSTKENNQKVSLNSYEPSESANIDEKEPISTNMKSGENEVTMPYSKELNEEIKSLNNGVSKEYDRKFISKPYYSNGNLVSTDGRRMKVIKVGELDGIPDNSFVDVTSSKDGIKIKKIEMKNFDGEDYKFPAYNRVIPDGNNLKVTTDNAALKNKIKEMMKDGSIDKKVNRIAIEFKNGSAYIDGTKIGDASDMPYENISINANYLLDGISGKDSILMLSDDPNKALTISTATTTNVIMPMQGDGSVPDYESGRNAKKESDNVKSEIKNRRKEELEGALKRYQEILKPETVDKLIKTVNDKGTKDHEGIIKNSYEAMIRAEKQLENPKSNYKDEFTNPYGIKLVAASRINPEFRTALVNMAKEYGLEIKKSIFDFIDFDVDDSEDDELEPNFEDESYSDYDASQPDLFNSTSYKVGAALDSIFGC